MASKQITHRRAVLIMIGVATLWSTAGVLTRHLDHARGFEVTFWRSVFAALFVLLALTFQQRGKAAASVYAVGKLGLLSGLMWGMMFCCFMLALTMTSVANTLIVMSVAPLLTALFARLFLHQRIAPRTWLAILLALIGMIAMFASGISHLNKTQLLGMLIALGVPLAASINLIAIKKAGHGVDLIPAVLLGGVFSALMMLPFALPLQASVHDVAILAMLGFFQLGLPCMLMVAVSKSLSAPEISLLALLEVLLGPIWAWLGANEIPSQETMLGGTLVLIALILNELAALRQTTKIKRDLHCG